MANPANKLLHPPLPPTFELLEHPEITSLMFETIHTSGLLQAKFLLQLGLLPPIPCHLIVEECPEFKTTNASNVLVKLL